MLAQLVDQKRTLRDFFELAQRTWALLVVLAACRFGVEPDDIVGAIRYLSGAPCVTGQILVVDSGHRFMGLERDVQFLGDD